MTMTIEVLAGLAFMFSSSILLQILACALYNNWWPMLSALMYVLVPMPCVRQQRSHKHSAIIIAKQQRKKKNTEYLRGSSSNLPAYIHGKLGSNIIRWIGAAKFLTGASAVGSIAIPIILSHADLIGTGAMLIEFTSFVVFVCTVLCFHHASLDDEW